MNLFTQKIAEVSISYTNPVKLSDCPKISCSRDAARIMQEHFHDAELQIQHREYFFVMLMNRGNRVLGISMISMGGMSGTVADPKIIFQLALKTAAVSLILVHNHPSGNKQPSESDIRLTKKLKSAGSFLDIPVIDHLVITPEEDYFSFADEGLL